MKEGYEKQEGVLTKAWKTCMGEIIWSKRRSRVHVHGVCMYSGRGIFWLMFEPKANASIVPGVSKKEKKSKSLLLVHFLSFLFGKGGQCVKWDKKHKHVRAQKSDNH